MSNLRSNVITHLESQHGELFSAWTKGTKFPAASVQEHCDMVYSLHLLGESTSISPAAVTLLCETVRGVELPGWHRNGESSSTLSVHNCAYLFGTLNVLGQRFEGLYSQVLEGRRFALEDLVKPQGSMPRFPQKWAHHSWRVSHWLGGIPSILLSLEENAPKLIQGKGVAAQARTAVDSLLDPETGLIRAYRSSALQKLFRFAYGLRHSPEMGDIGGIAHVLWIDHCMKRPYVAADAIRRLASRLLMEHKPFMESVPYCLDFDVVQAFRTACEQTNPSNTGERHRIEQLMQSIGQFFASPRTGYSLHKVPGALATHHECAQILDEAKSELSRGSPIDIILQANWL